MARKNKATSSWLGLPEADNPMDAQTGAIRLLAQGLAVLLVCTQFACLGLFYALGQASLVWVNLGSLLLCGAALALSGRVPLPVSWALMTAALVAQSSLSLWTLGWGSGFHYLLLLALPLLIGGPMRPLALKSVLSVGVFIAYLALDLTVRQRGGTPLLDARLQDALYYFNLTCALLMLLMLAGYVAQLLHESRLTMGHLAQIDALTQVRNRSVLLEVIERENARAQNEPVKLSVVLCNLDHLKLVNQTHGQHAGDAVLRAAGRVMAKGVRDADTMLRWTGDEFLAILPNTDQDGAQVVAERLRRGIESLEVSTGRQSLTVGMTVGVSTMQPGDRLEDVIARAQEAVSEGKQAGRRCIIYAYTPRVA